MKHKALQEPKPFKAFRDKYLAAVMMVAALLISFAASAQLDSAKYSAINGYGFKYKRMVFDSILMIPRSTSPHVPWRAGAIRYNAPDSTLQLWTGNQWNSILTGIGNGIDTAYMINDTLLLIETPDQNYMLAIAGRPRVDSIYRKAGQDSIYFTKNGIEYAIKDSTGGTTTTLNNVGTGFSWATTPNGSIKRLNPGYGLIGDSATSNTNGLKADTSSTNHLVTQSGLNDGLATKLNTSDTANEWINDIRRVPGSTTVEKFKNGSWSTAFTDSVGSGGGQTLVSDVSHLSEIKIYSPAVGYSSTANLTNYSHSNVDSSYAPISTTAWGIGSSDYGAWLFSGTSGQSIGVTAPFWVVFGDSQAEGHPNLHGRLHWLSSGTVQTSFKYDYPDSVGQLSYHLRQLTNMRWYNHGIGGQTSVDLIQRFYRDVLGVNSPNSNDGRGNRTLLRTPQGVVIIVGINDIFNGVPIQTLKDNIELMASLCQQYGVRCVFTNIPGDEQANQTQLGLIATMNEWFKSGVLDQYGASVVDYNRWWNNPTYGTPTNYKKNSLIFDDIHPTKVGYDSLAHFIFREARLPVLTKAVFINKLDPAGSPSYSRPVNITINGDAYSLSSDSATVNITTYVPDSVSIAVTSSTGGGTNSGLDHILWYTTNNPNDSTYYTRKTLYSGSQKAVISANKIKLISGTLVNGDDIIKTYLGDMTTVGLTVRHYAGTARMMLNGETILNSAAFSINGGGTSLSTDGNIISAGTRSQFNVAELNQNHSADNSGFGISFANTASSISIQGSGQAGKDLVQVTTWNGGGSNLGTNPTNLLSILSGFGVSTDINQRGNALSITPTINHNTSANSGIIIRGLYYNPTLTNLGNAKHNGIVQVSGDNYLNETSGNTCIGCAESVSLSAKLRVNGKAIINTIDSSGSPANMLWQDPNTGEIMKAAVPSGGLSGSGTSGRVAYWNGSSSLTSASNFLFDGSTLTVQSSGSGAGVYGSSNSGTGVVGESTSGEAFNYSIFPSSTNSITTVGRQTRWTSGTAANGIGGAYDFFTQKVSGTASVSTRLTSHWTDATNGIADFSIWNANTGSLYRYFTVKGTGQTELPYYGAGTFTGTPTGSLQVTSGGSVIEGPLVASGTWTPTLTDGTNSSGATVDAGRYTRVGNIVTFSLTITTTTSAGASATTVTATLPVASNFTTTSQASGTNSGLRGSVTSNTSDILNIDWVSNTGGTETITITGQYIIL